jgi:hypothetical protein
MSVLRMGWPQDPELVGGGPLGGPEDPLLLEGAPRGGAPGPPFPPEGGVPIATLVAATEPELSVPNTATCSPTVTLVMLGDVAPGSK